MSSLLTTVLRILYSVVQATLDLEDIDFRLPDDFKETLTDNLQKRFEYEFHSASYNEMIEVITALRTVCGHLVKVRARMFVSVHFLPLLLTEVCEQV